MKKNFICVLFTFTFETAKWITLYFQSTLKLNEFPIKHFISETVQSQEHFNVNDIQLSTTTSIVDDDSIDSRRVHVWRGTFP